MDDLNNFDDELSQAVRSHPAILMPVVIIDFFKI